jgi:Major Facilitator Superfamily
MQAPAQDTRWRSLNVPTRLGALIGFRVLQGAGGSMLNPAALGIITNTFTGPAERARAIGVWDGVFGLSMALGPAIAAMAGFLFLSTLYLQDVRGLSALQAGLAILPMPLVMALCAPLAGRMVAKRGPRIPLVIAGAALTLSSAALSRLTGTTDQVVVMPYSCSAWSARPSGRRRPRAAWAGPVSWLPTPFTSGDQCLSRTALRLASFANS